ncbi:glycerol-3-phosphate 1-O-acyltransferase PlsY [Marasmitruncus massiliensis]|uniref:glycerol-3-phosphate 1-O-acyltransferase PlsY n=1 Tax=Marasmitruncus massiliensis TaxID=1944642 RepID=UPI000C7CD138|nr:glycerol-3-phosphate 1-O-acyltransferase PlsY [Marasmitruncus massiliensis]
MYHAGLFWVSVFLSSAFSYLIGSISFSILFTRLFYNNVDIRTLGSGNAGLTNVLRSVGWKAGVFTFLFDFLKGAVSVIAGRAIFQYYCQQSGAPAYFQQYGALIAGLMCVVGHVYPLYFHFKGGKGILSSAAVVVFYDWRLFAIVFIVFAAVFIISKIVSLSSIIAAFSFPFVHCLVLSFWDYRTGRFPYGTPPISYLWITTALAAGISGLLIYKHKPNIKRLKNGTEKKFTLKRQS